MVYVDLELRRHRKAIQRGVVPGDLCDAQIAEDKEFAKAERQSLEAKLEKVELKPKKKKAVDGSEKLYARSRTTKKPVSKKG